MAGYIGSKTVNLSTTGADIAGDADVSGDLTVDTNTLHVDSTNNRVGVGTISPSAPLQVQGSAGEIRLQRPTASQADWSFKLPSSGGELTFYDNNNSSEAMRLDASGNLLVGKTSSDATATGFEAQGNGQTIIGRTNGAVLKLNRLSSDGDIALFRKDGTTVGGIGNLGTTLFIQTSGNQAGLGFYSGHVSPRKNNAASDNAIDLGRSSQRYDDIYVLSVISTSDRNEKQDIAELSDAEQRVAVAAKGLLRKFRWKNRVAEKGDEARTHFGIIAQDLQAAFAAEGLDAGDYAMFISTTWWEHDVEVPAVEAVAEVLDDDGNVVTEAVEAKDAYTRTDTYDTQEEAPEGATERTRLGVRYSELLAFIIGAL